MNAFETVLEIVRNKVAVMNICFNSYYERKDEALERYRHELTGMLVCLKNINETENFYNVNYSENGYEFGYYDAEGKWVSIEK